MRSHDGAGRPEAPGPISSPSLSSAIHIDDRRTTVAGRALAIAAAALIWLAASAGPVSADPPGGSGRGGGTVTVDGLPVDGRGPHVGCTFQIDFYGFDEGADLFADVSFEAHPPTGRGVLIADRVFIGEDDDSGGASAAGLDAQRSYDLSAALQAFTPHPNQGFHVKLTVNADGSHGADTRHRVFWVTGCSTPTSPPPPPPPGGAVSPDSGPTPPTRGVVLPSVGGPGGGILPDTAVPIPAPLLLTGVALVLAAASAAAAKASRGPH